ncbi:DUF4136 domain-containing protein [Massilia cavernae]|uniref:DUF4136 domain-containing protein n=1 Tax=Massilia cavernae TaxID=2320864 RepID=A0A418Y6M7_9BURK|nr:DUF4136 domain-containing protein [Massilia cavernae]RJG23940.1 DUF4136 domain-containing protein [Massilia cavernae]
MRRILTIATAALTLLLGGCATTIRSDVTTFHQWPGQLQEKTYSFEAPAPQDDTLELRSYQQLVRSELARLGFQDAGTGPSALKVAMRFMTTDIPVRVYQPVYSHFDYYWMPRSAYMMRPYPYHRRHGYWRGWYSPFYDPFWYGTPAYHETIVHNYRRELQVAIKDARDGKRLFDVTVQNISRELSTPKVMPALVHSAFLEFPGVSGVARRVELKLEEK